jgi:hypothetical protein
MGDLFRAKPLPGMGHVLMSAANWGKLLSVVAVTGFDDPGTAAHQLAATPGGPLPGRQLRRTPVRWCGRGTVWAKGGDGHAQLRWRRFSLGDGFGEARRR